MFFFLFCRSSPLSQLQHVTTDNTNINESWSDDSASVDDYSTSDEETTASSPTQQDDESTNNEESSTSGDDSETSSEEEDNIDGSSTDISNDPALVCIRSLIKRVRELVTVVHQSGPLSEYVREQAKAKKLPGEVSKYRKNIIIIMHD